MEVKGTIPGRAPRGLIAWATLLCLMAFAVPAAAQAATFEVNDTGDPGVGICDGAECTLREAIDAANSNPGTDTIAFSTLAGGTISPLSALPDITEPTVIDGETATGWSAGAPVMELDGALAGPNDGLTLAGTSSPSTIQGLVLNSWDGMAIRIEVGITDTTIRGNWIGTNLAGTAADANTVGVWNYGSGVTIGGSSPADRNVISGNTGDGVHSEWPAGAMAVLGNYIGTNPAGTSAIPNDQGIAALSLDPVTIGGPAPGQGNLISGNSSSGVIINAPDSTLAGNRIGTNAAGTAAISNDWGGVQLSGLAPGIEIRENQISGNSGFGLQSFAPDTRLYDNLFGTDVAGTAALPNGTGIEIQQGSGFVSDGDTIAFNTGDGVWVADDPAIDQVEFSNASIHSNGGLGIDLGDDGVTANDVGDADIGPNGRQNFPVIDSATTTDAGHTAAGSINTTASTFVTIDFYTVPTCDPSGHGEGADHIGSTTATTDGSGNATFSQYLPAHSTDGFVTATATTASGTSEFSTCRAVDFIPFPPPLEPKIGKKAVAAPVSGKVTVLRPGGSEVTLKEGEEIPVGSVVDATRGEVSITTETASGGTQTARFYAGAFKLLQKKGQTLVTLVLAGGKKRSRICRPKKRGRRGRARSLDFPAVAISSALATTSSSKRSLRRLWGHGKGKFKTKGNHGSATVRGTYWYTADRCDGTFFKVRDGVVDVRDFGRKNRKIVLRKGKTYLAKMGKG